MIIYWCMTVNGGNEMKALLLKTSVWLVLLFSVMGLWQVSNAAEQYTPIKAHVVTTIDKATTDKQQVTPTKEAAHQFGEEAATNVSASAQGTADEINNKVTSNAFSNKTIYSSFNKSKRNARCRYTTSLNTKTNSISNIHIIKC